MKKNRESYSSLIQRAWLFAMQAHEGQLDDSGKDYFTEHCMQVFRLLQEVTDDEEVWAAGLLHDTIEDTEATEDEILKNFGPRIYRLVMEVTHEGKKDEHGYYFPRLHSEEGIIIKFADRLSNLSRMSCWDESRRLHYIKKSKFWKNKINEK